MKIEKLYRIFSPLYKSKIPVIVQCVQAQYNGYLALKPYKDTE